MIQTLPSRRDVDVVLSRLEFQTLLEDYRDEQKEFLDKALSQPAPISMLNVVALAIFLGACLASLWGACWVAGWMAGYLGRIL